MLDVKLVHLALSLLWALGAQAQTSHDTTLTVFFESGMSTLDSNQTKNIESFVLSIGKVEEVAGFADTIGSVQSNRSLSRLRANSVWESIGSDPQVVVTFHGEEFIHSPELSVNRKVQISARKRNPMSVYPKFSVVDSFDIENINFIADKSIITAESMNSIPTLIRKLRSYQGAHFDIIGHVNYQSKKDQAFLRDLFKLSEDRAKVIFALLLDNGFSKESLNYKGVGNSRPLIPAPRNDEERKRNMRVQIIVENQLGDK